MTTRAKARKNSVKNTLGRNGIKPKNADITISHGCNMGGVRDAFAKVTYECHGNKVTVSQCRDGWFYRTPQGTQKRYGSLTQAIQSIRRLHPNFA